MVSSNASSPGPRGQLPEDSDFNLAVEQALSSERRDFKREAEESRKTERFFIALSALAIGFATGFFFGLWVSRI